MSRLNCSKIRNLRLNAVSKKGEILLINDLANTLELSHNVISRMENDQGYNPGVLNLLKVSEYFNVTIDSLIIKD